MKKGISALVSTVLLVTFVIALGLIFIGWSSGLLKRSIERSESKVGTELDCMDVELKLERDNGTMIIKNNGKKALGGYIVRIVKTDNQVKVDRGEGENRVINAYGAKAYDYETYVGRAEVNIGIGEIDKIEIIPKVDIGEGQMVDCVNKMVAYTIS